MSDEKRRARACRVDEIERLRSTKGYSIDRLAEKSGLNRKTIERILNGKPAFIGTVAAIAQALGTTTDALIVDTPRAKASEVVMQDTTFRLDLSFYGTLSEPIHATRLLGLANEIANILSRDGVCVRSQQGELSLQRSRDDEVHRVIVQIYGILANGGPCWIMAAVRPSRYAHFMIDYKKNLVDIHNFLPYGEIIVSGEGTHPSRSIARKIAEMYRMDDADGKFVNSFPPDDD